MKEKLEEYLFREGTYTLAVLDGASVPDLPGHIHKLEPPSTCLYTGELAPDLQYAAPYLVYLFPGAPFSDWVLGECWGKHWGIFAHSRHSLREMRRHFRSLITVYNEDGKPMIFRYYDPRVLTSFLPTCSSDELQTVFGKVDRFFAENVEAGHLMSYSLEAGELNQIELR
jgi:hypothetical protein